jgi:hypothetical protein
MIRSIDLSHGKAARRGTALLLMAILSIGLTVAPAQAGSWGGRGKYYRTSSTHLVYATPVYRRPFIARTRLIVPRRTVRVYRAPTVYVARSYVARTAPVYVTRRAFPVYRTTSFYRTTPTYFSTGRSFYPGYYDPAPYRRRHSTARNVLTVAAGAGAGALVGGLLGGRKGAVIGAIAGGIGGAALTRVRGDRYRY